MTSLKQVQLPVSKSLYIRKLIFDFLNNGRVGEIPDGVPVDVQVVHDALMLIDQTLHTSSHESEPVVVDVHDCGAAYRFLMAVLAVTSGQWLLTGTKRLLQRPIEELVEALRSIGAEIQWYPCRDVPWRVSTTNGDEIFYRDAMHCVSTNDDEMSSRGDARPFVSTNAKQGWLIHDKPLHASDLTIDCHRSGQFASALLLIGGKIGLKNLHILPENPPSLSYIKMTKAVVNGSVKLEDEHLADWSAAVYWYARLLLESQMQSSNRLPFPSDTAYGNALASYKLLHLDMNSIQSDAVIARWFSGWGIESRQEEDGVLITYKENFFKPQELIELDMSQNLDLVPVLACMACLWPKTMVLNGVANLKYKESDRLQQLCGQLAPFAHIEVEKYENLDGNRLIINPNQQILYPNKLYFDANVDHRLVMAFSLFALKCTVCIKGFDSVKKSYPNFHAEGVVGGTDMVG
jgi:3-phosphoshikimate 1-carboxyvinyltransferase